MSARPETVEPPRSHFMQELGLDFEARDEVWTGEALVPAGAWLPGTRYPLTSVLLMYGDVIAGGQVRERTLPQLSMTVDLAVDVVDADAPKREVGELSARSRILRGGKRLYFTETTMATPDGSTLAVCTGSFSAISRTLNALGNGPFERASRFERPLLEVPLADRVGLEIVQPGLVEVSRRPDLGNSTDTLMGGLHALLGETAALSRVEADAGVRYFADRLHVRYLAPVRIGPARATAALFGGTSSRRVVRVELRDAGAPDQLAADVTVSCAPMS